MSHLAGQLNAGTYRLLELIADFEELGGCGNTGARSTAHYLTWRCGIALRSAQEHVRVALALRRLSKIAAALRRGEISYSKARAVTRVATSVDEDFFLNMAKSGTASHVERIVRLARKHVPAVDDRRAATRQYLNRSVRCHREEDGSLRIEARLPADDGALVMRALQASLDILRADVFENERGSSHPVAQPRSAERSAPPRQSKHSDPTRGEAFVAMAESFLADGRGL